MPALPSRRDMGGVPRVDAGGRVAAPDTSAVGRALVGLGDDITTGIAVLEAGWKDAKKADANSRYIQFEYNELQQLDEAKRNLKPEDAEGFSSRYYQGFLERARAETGSYDPSIRQDFQDKAFVFGQGTLTHSSFGTMSAERTGLGLMLDQTIDNTSTGVWEPRIASAATIGVVDGTAELENTIAEMWENMNAQGYSQNDILEKGNKRELDLRLLFMDTLSVKDKLTLDPSHPSNTAPLDDPEAAPTGFYHTTRGVPLDEVMKIVEKARGAAVTRTTLFKNELNSVIDALTTGTPEGDFSPEALESFSNGTIAATLNPDEATIFISRMATAKRFGEINRLMKDASPRQMDILIAEAEAIADSDLIDGAADDATVNALKTMKTNEKEYRRLNPVAASMRNEEVGKAYSKYAVALSGEEIFDSDEGDGERRAATPEETAQFLHEALILSKNEQIRLGIHPSDTKVMTDEIRTQIIKNFESKVSEEGGRGVAEELAQLSQVYGPAWPDALKDLVSKGEGNDKSTLPQELQVAANMIPGAPGQSRLYDLIDAQNNGAEILKNLPDGVKDEIFDTVDTAALDLYGSLNHQGRGDTAIKTYRHGIALLAAGYYRDTLDAAEAVEKAYADIADSQWNFVNGYRVPRVFDGKEVDATKVSQGAKYIAGDLQRIDNMVLPPTDREGATEEHIREQYIDHLMAYGTWITSPNEDGLVYYDPSTSYGDAIRGSGTDLSYKDENGEIRPIVFTWEELEDRYDLNWDAAQAAVPTTPLGRAQEGIQSTLQRQARERWGSPEPVTPERQTHPETGLERKILYPPADENAP